MTLLEASMKGQGTHAFLAIPFTGEFGLVRLTASKRSITHAAHARLAN